MKAAITYSFILLYLLAMVRPVAPMVSFYSNQNFIEQAFCVNKAKSGSNCHGHCYLKKQLNTTDEDQQLPQQLIIIQDYPIGFVNFFSEGSILRPNMLQQFIPIEDNILSFFSFSVFHPPKI